MSALRRLHAPALRPEGGPVDLGREAARHARVLRLSVGDDVLLFDGRGAEARARITHLGDELRCDAEPTRAAASDGPPIVLCLCVPKGGKLEDVVRATTELGVGAVHLAHAARSVPRADGSRLDARLARLVRVAAEAARQSGRSTVPDVVAPAPLEQVLARAPDDAARLVLSPDRGVDLAAACAPDAPAAWIVVGPEGGLSPDEIGSAEALGFSAVDLGPRVLRVQTAATVAVALVAHRLGALGPASSRRG